MSIDNIQPGMIVWLKTGGPAMTVKWLTNRQDWLCSWFVGTEIKEHGFSDAQLTDKDPTPQIELPVQGGSSWPSIT